MNRKTILVTGAARRVGSAIARALHATGANILVHYHLASEAAAALVAELNLARPSSAACLQADLRQVETSPPLVAATIDRFGRLDALVNNASSFFPTPFGSIDVAAWDELLDSNLKAPLFLTQAAAPHLKAAGGSIVNVSSVGGVLADTPFMATYSVSKAGVIGLTKSVGKELATTQIRVNCVTPGVIRTDMNRDLDESALLDLADRTPLGRPGEPREVASALVFLAGEGASFITGQVLFVDGGKSLGGSST